ncbi:insertion sequence 2 OrfA protein [Klebsiella pneumoniae]|uniref:Insertion sequence 2 OrfA protein n=1 Tax=Klebsiella pneumoniae TaxID=573 RepID=A0A377XBE3_KLEPN|nr:transposase family protein [Escherichia coli DEC10E]STT78960.1 insertion sequence 2 OrfA protein [Klebsiella pneumoniae]
MIDVLGPEKRRRRTTQEKIAIVQQSFEPGMTVSLVARQHGVAASQLFSGASNTRREVLLLWPQESRSFLPLNLLLP